MNRVDPGKPASFLHPPTPEFLSSTSEKTLARCSAAGRPESGPTPGSISGHSTTAVLQNQQPTPSIPVAPLLFPAHAGAAWCKLCNDTTAGLSVHRASFQGSLVPSSMFKLPPPFPQPLPPLPPSLCVVVGGVQSVIAH